MDDILTQEEIKKKYLEDTPFNNYMSSLSDKVVKNVELIPKENMEYPLLHGSLVPVTKPFEPRIGTTQAPSEDRTVPRICTSDTLLGCLRAMPILIEMVAQSNYNPWKSGKVANSANIKDKYLGGWYLYAFQDYEWCLKPTKKLCFDSDITREHWLVNYSPETRQYKAVEVAKMFIATVTYQTRVKERSACTVMLYIEVMEDMVIKVKHDDKVEYNIGKGYWRLTFSHSPYYQIEDEDGLIIQDVSKAEYLKAKGASADLLSYKRPSYLDL